MTFPQPHTTPAPLDFPRLDLGDDRHKRFRVIHGQRHTVIEVKGDAMAEINAEASSMSLEGEERDRALALFSAPPPRRGYPSVPRSTAPSAKAIDERRTHAEARAAVLAFTGHRAERIPPTGPVRIRTRARRDRLWTLGLATAALSCCGLLGVLVYLSTR